LAAIERGWDELLRLAASIRSGRVSATLALQRFGSAAQGDPLHRAAEHLGRLLRTVFLCDYIAIEDFRREIHSRFDSPRQHAQEDGEHAVMSSRSPLQFTAKPASNGASVRIGFLNALFFPHGTANTALDAYASVFEGSGRPLSIDGAAENRPHRSLPAISLVASPLKSVPPTLEPSRLPWPVSPGRLNGHGWAASGRLQGLATSWCPRWRPSLQAQVRVDLLDDRLLQDRRDDLQLAAAVGAVLQLEVKHALEKPRSFHQLHRFKPARGE
jgi:hypothetical protein